MTPEQILDEHFGYTAADPDWVVRQLVLAGDLRTIEALEATPRKPVKPRMFPYMEAIGRRYRKPVSRRTYAICWGIGAFCLIAIIAMGVPGAMASYQLSTL